MQGLAVLVAAGTQVAEASGGASTESILVFVGGVVAALAAVIAALVTSRAAGTRLEKALTHEQYVARRSEASKAVEDVARLVAKTMASLDDWMINIENSERRREAFTSFTRNLDQLREETNVVALRFGLGTPLVKRMKDLIDAVNEALPSSNDDLPLSEDRQKELKASRGNLGKANARFLAEAINALEAY